MTPSFLLALSMIPSSSLAFLAGAVVVASLGVAWIAPEGHWPQWEDTDDLLPDTEVPFVEWVASHVVIAVYGFLNFISLVWRVVEGR